MKIFMNIIFSVYTIVEMNNVYGKQHKKYWSYRWIN